MTATDVPCLRHTEQTRGCTVQPATAALQQQQQQQRLCAAQVSAVCVYERARAHVRVCVCDLLYAQFCTSARMTEITIIKN